MSGGYLSTTEANGEVRRLGIRKRPNKVAREGRERLAKGELGVLREKCPTVASYGRQCLDSPLKDWAEGTKLKYKEIFALHIKPNLGGKRLDEVKRRNIKAFHREPEEKRAMFV